MWLGLHNRLDEGDSRGADLLSLSHHPGRRPFRVAPVRTWHVLTNRCVPALQVAAGMAGNPAALVEDLDRCVGYAGLDLLADQARRYRVVVVVDLDVIVGRNPALLPFGIL